MQRLLETYQGNFHAGATRKVEERRGRSKEGPHQPRTVSGARGALQHCPILRDGNHEFRAVLMNRKAESGFISLLGF